MRRYFRSSMVGLAALVWASVVEATPVVVNGSFGGYLGSGTSSGRFDGSALPSSGYQIDGATFSFTFYNDQSNVSVLSTQQTGTRLSSYGLYYSGYDGSNNIYDYRRTSTTYQQVVQEVGQYGRVDVQMGGHGVGAGAATESTSVGDSDTYAYRTLDADDGNDGYSYTYRCGLYTCIGYQPGTWYYFYSDHYLDTSTQTIDWRSNFFVTGTLSDTAMLDSLLSTGYLDYDLQVQGNVELLVATLTLDLEPTSVTYPNGIPERTSMLLVATALGGLAWGRRQRRARA